MRTVVSARSRIGVRSLLPAMLTGALVLLAALAGAPAPGRAQEAAGTPGEEAGQPTPLERALAAGDTAAGAADTTQTTAVDTTRTPAADTTRGITADTTQSAAGPRGVTAPDTAAAGATASSDTTASPDTTARAGTTAGADSMARADTVGGDALYQRLAGEAPPGQIVYRGNELTLFPPEKVILLSGNAEAKQDSSILSADRIAYIREENIIQAFGGASVERGANQLSADTLFYDQGSGYVSTFGPSTLKEGTRQVTGSDLQYSLDKRSGTLTAGRTEYDRWYLRGEDMNKIGERTFLVEGGTFTTDPADPPDYHFGAKRIKLRQEDVIIARPVVLYVSDVPVFYLPWYLEPLGTGRKSGILRPNIGLNTLINASGNERNVQNLGYYWAISDYMDAQAALDWFSRSRTVARLDYRYAIRYLLRGSAHYERVWNREVSSTQTLFRFSHDHEFDPSTQLRVDANISSTRQFFEDNSFDPDRLTQRALRSNASFNRRFSWGNLSLGAFSDFQLLQQRTDFKIPSLALSLNTRPLFPGSRLDEGGWKKNMQIGASTTFDFDYATQGDTLSGQDSTIVNQQTSVTRATLSGPFTLLGFIKTNPSVDITETLFRNAALPDSLADAGEPSFAHLETFGMGLSLAGSVFRIFEGGPGPVTKMRHTFAPSVSFRYQPATRAREDLPLNFPGGGGQEAMSASFAIANDLDLKIRETRAQADRREQEADRIRRAREAGLLKPRDELTVEEQAILDSIAVADSLSELEYQAVEDSLDRVKEAVEAAREGERANEMERLAALRDSLQVLSDSLEAARAEQGMPPDSVARLEARGEEERAEDTEEAQELTERTVKLISVTNRFGFDFVRNSDPRLLGLTTLSTSATSQVSSAVNVSVSLTHDLTDTRSHPNGGTEEFFDPFLQSLNTVVRFGGGRDFPSSRSFTGRPGLGEKAVNDAEAGQGSLSPGVGNEEKDPTGFEAIQSSGFGRWSVDLTHTLTRVRDSESRQSLRFGTSFRPTRNWSLRYSSGYNITETQFQDQSISLVRDLNRWQASLNLNVFPQEPQDRLLVEFSVFLRDVPSLKVPYRVRRE